MLSFPSCQRERATGHDSNSRNLAGLPLCDQRLITGVSHAALCDGKIEHSVSKRYREGHSKGWIRTIRPRLKSGYHTVIGVVELSTQASRVCA